ncbi:Fc receptor-like protein 5 [Mauremys mutica]|uniref:Fc receptor-like protein 5 n=1 Tax=Mauremys mutica TaxID=74926 RepID=UPI001D15F0CA|nr:Fc receptor-like protein 5 [Mauremys mutica]
MSVQDSSLPPSPFSSFHRGLSLCTDPSASVLAPPPAPRLSQDPGYTVYLPGERVTLTCSAPGGELDWSYRFFYQEGQQEPSVVQHPNEGTRLELTAQKGNAGTYTCAYWRWESNREISSWPSNSISITVTDPPPQPVLELDPPSGVVSEGLPLLITCAVSRDAREGRFHFYKDGVKIVPGDMGSEINTTEPGTGSMNVSVLSIPQAGPNNAGKFTCGYEENVGARWIPSPRSRAVNVTVNVTRTASARPAAGAVLWAVGL